ncbi:hypothetical protein [Flaviaesturariibacter amylovorans]|uniref:DUF3575 domain-containing protein n=1 Tax=Flaviaesturariibacter amylovorans TaxID=1084520 RepID=A0ABP8G734_9BACT
MLKKKTNCLLALLLLCIAQPVLAQSKREARDSSVTIIFSEEKTTRKKKKVSGDANIIKIAPLGFITGQFPLLYERRLTDFLTVQVGGGLTNRNYMRGLMIRARDEDASSIIKEYPWSNTNDFDMDQTEQLYSFEYRKPKMGYMYRVEPRIYFENEAPEGNYIGLQYNYARYNFSIPAYVNGEHSGDLRDEYENITDFMVHFGNQWVHDRITIESSSAIGLRKVKGSKYVNNGNGSEGFATYDKSSINFGVTFTIGYHF